MLQIFNDGHELDAAAAKFIQNNLVLALPAGRTPLGMYRELIKKKINWARVKIFMLDVNYPQNQADPNSFLSYIKLNLLNHIPLPPENFNILDSQTDDPEKECQEYEAKIASAGGLDLAVLGIGENGHIAYNEPGSSFQSITRKVRLGLTMGIKTIMSAKKIILLAKGRNKARAVKAAIEGPVSLDCPASVLQNHPNTTYLIDEDAARLLSNHGKFPQGN